MRRLSLTLVLVPSMFALAYGQEAPKITAPDPLAIEGYIEPPAPIRDAIKAPRWQNLTLSNLSPNGKWFAVARATGPVTVVDVSRSYVNLAGLQVDVKGLRSRTTYMRGSGAITFIDPKTNARVEAKLPPKARVSGLEWSPKGTYLGFIAHMEDASYIYVADPATGACRMVSNRALLATEVEAIQWTSDETSIFAVLAPGGRGSRMSAPDVPTQPRVQVSDPAKTKNRPVRNLLETKVHQDMYEYFVTGQLARINVATGAVGEIGTPGMIRDFNVAPDGSALRVTTILKPFSYVVFASSFGSKEELLDPTGKLIVELSKRELAPMEPPAGGAPATPADGGRRSLSWRPDGKGLSYIRNAPRQEAPANPTPPDDEQGRGGGGQRGGAGAQGAGGGGPAQVVQWSAPYGKDDIKVVFEHTGSIGGVSYSEDCTKIFLSVTNAGKSETVMVDLANGNKKTTLSSWTSTDFYANPGSMVSKTSANGPSCVRISSDGSVYFSGTQYDKDWEKIFPRSFIDKVSLADGKKERVWQSATDTTESVSSWLDDDFKQVVISRQSRTLVPNQSLLDVASKSMMALTKNVDFVPEFTNAQVFRVQVKRPDGFKFWATVTMPAWWVKGASPLPGFFWFYPGEFVDQKSYDDSKRTTNLNTFPVPSTLSSDYAVLLGYASVEPDCPIVGPAERKNDTYIADLRNNLSATIDALAAQGFIDRSRLAIGGHSYGAFSTANAMVQTPFFKAGIAGDGAYNRMLTPMAFQSETRTLWEARETYLDMSPMLFAEQITGALLLYHGMDDNNMGTHPINSERMFNALDGLGKDVALYMYPYEDHGPAARESFLDIWARWAAWLDKYVKNAK